MKTIHVSMMNYSNLQSVVCRIVVAVVALAVATGCSGMVDTDLGYEMIPEHQKMEMRHLEFKGGKLITFDWKQSTEDKYVSKELPGNFFETRLYHTDSLLSSNVSYGYLGVERSDTFGVRSAALASSIMFMNKIDEEDGFGYKPIFDTLRLVLSVEDYGADTLTPVRYTVYEVKNPLLGSVINSKDTTAYTSCDLSLAYDETKPLFTFTFPDGEKTGPVRSSVVLEPVEGGMKEGGATWNFVRRLMCVPDNYTSSDWDGYARDVDSLYIEEKNFSKAFNGLCFVPDVESAEENKRGALYSFKLASSGVMLEARNRNPEDPTLIKDTIAVAYYFFDESLAEEDGLNMSVNSIKHDYQKSLTSAPSKLSECNFRAYDDAGNSVPRTERTLVKECFIEGCGGVATELYFTDEFLLQLKALTAADNSTDGLEYRTIGINQCLLTVYTKGADYDWNATQGNASLIELYESSLDRLGTYLKYSTLTAITDYDYEAEVNQTVDLNYDGYLNRSRGCYVMNITGYMQRLYNYVRSLDDLADYNEVTMPRSLYLGPQATTPYTFKRSVVQGSVDDSSDIQAPIHIEMLYTMIK